MRIFMRIGCTHLNEIVNTCNNLRAIAHGNELVKFLPSHFLSSAPHLFSDLNDVLACGVLGVHLSLFCQTTRNDTAMKASYYRMGSQNKSRYSPVLS